MAVQWIGYLLDVSNGRLPPQKELVSFMLYSFYFPRVVSGPVEKAKPFFTRLEKPLVVDRSLSNAALF
jgi:D-alanyl-lipoteichoic acid acyltransferase DltB (MBOAT superfamily)